MNKFKIGDMVKLSPDSKYVGLDMQLPLGVVGKVVGYGSSQLWYSVQWGRQKNSYQDHDLVRAKAFKGNK